MEALYPPLFVYGVDEPDGFLLVWYDSKIAILNV